MSNPMRQKAKQEFRDRLQALRDQGFEPYEIEALLTGCASQDMIDRAEARAHAKRKSEYEHEHRKNLRKQR
jgi:DNA-binding transcriptional MerR regulator